MCSIKFCSHLKSERKKLLNFSPAVYVDCNFLINKKEKFSVWSLGIAFHLHCLCIPRKWCILEYECNATRSTSLELAVADTW